MKSEWDALEDAALDELDLHQGESARGYFYLGIALYRMDHFKAAMYAYQKCTTLNGECAEAHYNLAISYVKNNKPKYAVDHFKIVFKLEPMHPWAYCNLAFLYNTHQHYVEALVVCMEAEKLFGDYNHRCYKHWAYALFMKEKDRIKMQNNMSEAFKKITLATQLNPEDADCWIMWALMLRSIGNYVLAQHKLDVANKLSPDHPAIKYE